MLVLAVGHHGDTSLFCEVTMYLVLIDLMTVSITQLHNPNTKLINISFCTLNIRKGKGWLWYVKLHIKQYCIQYSSRKSKAPVVKHLMG